MRVVVCDHCQKRLYIGKYITANTNIYIPETITAVLVHFNWCDEQCRLTWLEEHE